MNRSKLLLLLTVLLALFLTSCENRPNVTEPTQSVAPSYGSVHASQDPAVERIHALIVALYPEPGLRTAALKLWGNIQRTMDRGLIADAQAQTRGLASQVTDLATQGRLDTPDDPENLPGTVREAVSELVTRLFAFVGLEASDALQEYSGFLPQDFGSGEIDPNTGGVVVTGNSWAAVVAPPDATGSTVYITIELLDQSACEGAGPAVQANGCWEINRYPEGAFDHDVKVEICVADNPTTPLSNTEWNSLVVYQSDPGTVRALPWVSPDENIDCSGFGGSEQIASSSRLRSLFASVGSRVAHLILPEPLAASPPFFSHPPMGIGGTTGAFSEFFGAPSGHSVSGTVRYSDHALSGVRVTMNPTDDAADLVEDTTDAAGHYDFRGIVPGDYTVKVYGDGYEYPAGSGEYPFVGWVGQDVQVVDDNVVQDMYLPKNIILSEPANGATVDPNGLTLSWTPNAEAEAGGHYDIQINDTDHWFPTAETGQSNTASYQVQTALEPGEAYTWQVDALDAQGHEVGYSEMAFEYTLSGGAPVVVNGDFGTGDLTGWDSYGTQNWSAAAVSVGGNWAGQLDAGDGPTGDASCTDANYENFGILQQSFTMQKNHFMELDFQVPPPIDDPTENASCVGFDRIEIDLEVNQPDPFATLMFGVVTVDYHPTVGVTGSMAVFDHGNQIASSSVDPTNVTSPVVAGPLVLEPSPARPGWLHASLKLGAETFPWLPDDFTARVTVRNEDNERTGKNLSVSVDNVQGSS